jgi:hypothetical protein
VEDSKGKLVYKFQMNLDFSKNLRNFTRRFRRNLVMDFFLNSSRLLKDFKKMQYAMP